jgi:hypothetical protein
MMHATPPTAARVMQSVRIADGGEGAPANDI